MLEKRIENLKYKLVRVITNRLKQPDLTCDDILKLSQASAALEQNDIIRTLSRIGIEGLNNETDI